VQKPPTAQNYAIGCFGNVTGAGPFAGPPGYQEGSNLPGLQPQSLYLEQGAQRQTSSAPPDVTAPSAPSLASTGSSSTSVDLAWTASSDDVAVDGYNIFSNGSFAGFATGRSFTVTGLKGATSYSFTVHAADANGNLSESSNAVLLTAAPSSERPPIVFEAEDLVFTAEGANRSVANETFASGGQFPSNFSYVSFGADGTPPQGEYIDLVLPAVPAGTYTLLMRYKTHPANRGILQLALDGQPLGAPLNQHSSPATFLETNFGLVRFASQGDHTVRLLVTGRDATALTYTITADVFTLQPDNSAPLINAPSSMTLEATGPDGTVATYSGSATDDSDGVVPVRFEPPSGTRLPLGSTAVTASAQDSSGNTTRVTFNVTVVDSTPPVLALPANPSLETRNPAGALATFAASARDIVSGNVEVTLAPSSGTRFALGATTVTATASDDVGNQATGSFIVTVRVSAWTVGVAYNPGDLALYQGSTWRNIQAHRSQSDWTPERTPALWVKVAASDQWDQPVQYAVGVRVSYAGLQYQCLQAHTSQVGWTPPATPALWRRILN
jgi:chitodextrinase